MTDNERQALLQTEIKTFTDLVNRQRTWSTTQFGESVDLPRILNHITEATGDVEKEPARLHNWIDIVLLAMDGAWRAGHSPKEVVQAIQDVQVRNIMRDWQNPGDLPIGEPIKHIRSQAERITAGELTEEEARLEK